MNRIMILAGGTGGHVMPALAVAEYLREHGNEVVWIGTADGIEAKLVVRAKFKFIRIRIKSVRGKGIVRLLGMPFMLAWSMLCMVVVMLWYKPDAILGMGGFISGPGGLVAALLKKPLVIHEQNSVAGLTNLHLSKYAARVLGGFPQAKGISSSTWVGNPVRHDIINLPDPKKRLSQRKGALRLLVVGGSQGAEVFNQRIPELLMRQSDLDVEVWHQCGRVNAGAIGERYLAAGIQNKVNGFIHDMAKAYEWCDLIICRAGAMSIAEICAAGCAALLVPYPHAVNDHQHSNAKYLSSQGAAVLVQQNTFIKGAWIKQLNEFQQDRQALVKLATTARSLAKVYAVKRVADTCLEVCSA